MSASEHTCGPCRRGQHGCCDGSLMVQCECCGMATGVSADERLVAVLAEHQYVPSMLRGVSKCACGVQLHGMPHDHHPHLAAALRDAGWVHRDEVIQEAAELADTVIVSWSAVPGLHPTEPEPHPAALRAAGARRTLVVLRSRMTQAFTEHLGSDG